MASLRGLAPLSPAPAAILQRQCLKPQWRTVFTTKLRLCLLLQAVRCQNEADRSILITLKRLERHKLEQR